MVIRIKCVYFDKPAIFRLSILQYDNVKIRASIAVKTYEWLLCLPAILIGWDIERFLESTKSLLEEKQPEARLISFDEEIEVSFIRLSRLRPDIMIIGKLNQPSAFVDEYPFVNENNCISSVRKVNMDFERKLQGIKSNFGGLMTDTTEIRKFLNELHRFMIQSKISTKNPWKT